MGIMFHMFLFAFWVNRTPKCEADIFHKFWSAYMHASHINYIDVPILLRAHAACMSCMPNVMSLGVAYDANHVIMMSSASTFHSCLVGMMWHAIIGVHVACTPHHHGLLHIGMTYT